MSRFITYLALSDAGFVGIDDLIHELRVLAGDAPFSFERIDNQPSMPGRGYMLSVNGIAVTALFRDEPLPPDAWEEPARRAILWREAGQVLVGNKAHVVVAAVEDTCDHLGALGAASAVTMVAGALAMQMSVLATVFSESQSVVDGRMTAGMARGFAQKREVPELLWTNIQFFPGENPPGTQPAVGALTTGLLPFIDREIEFQPVPMQPGEIAQRLLGLCQYLMLQGPVIKDGETVGLSEQEKIRVRFANEGLRPGIPVMQLTLEKAASQPSQPNPSAGSSRARPALGRKGQGQ